MLDHHHLLLHGWARQLPLLTPKVLLQLLLTSLRDLQP
jgi:hypothetical protein